MTGANPAARYITPSHSTDHSPTVHLIVHNQESCQASSPALPAPAHAHDVLSRTHINPTHLLDLYLLYISSTAPPQASYREEEPSDLGSAQESTPSPSRRAAREVA